ncbi:MAG: hypothetical protein A2Y55_07080 [Actinobacteria bacterium RBG_16_68_12]|nr:MAG: hypothetical protein A2Y55_07080 [Actinobacteria bacterium RBG_16_68_12]
MRAWLAFLTRGRLLELALAVALGSAAVAIAESISDTATSVLAQHVGRDPTGEDGTVEGLLNLFSSQPYLNFSVGDTIVVYGAILSALLTLALLALFAAAVVRQLDRMLGRCPFCASRIPHESTHCAYCGSTVAPGEP